MCHFRSDGPVVNEPPAYPQVDITMPKPSHLMICSLADPPQSIHDGCHLALVDLLSLLTSAMARGHILSIFSVPRGLFIGCPPWCKFISLREVQGRSEQWGAPWPGNRVQLGFLSSGL